MKIYFNSIGIITNVSNIGDSLRQGSVGNVLEAHFEGVDNAYHSAKFNFTRSDGSKVNNVVMEWDNNNAEVFRFVFNDSWFFALAGTTTLTIYLYDTNGNVTTQGQHQFSIESTDYDEEPTITINQYNEIMTAIAGKVATSNIIDNLESDASDKPLSARMGKALKQDVDTSVASAKSEIYAKVEEETTRIETELDTKFETEIAELRAEVAEIKEENEYLKGEVNDLRNGLYGSILATETQEYDNVGVAVMDRANGYPIVDNQKSKLESIKGRTLNVNQLVDYVNDNAFNDKTSVGVELTADKAKGTITLNGTATELRCVSIAYLPLVSGDTYIVRTDKSINPNIAGTTILQKENYKIVKANETKDTYVTVRLDEGVKYDNYTFSIWVNNLTQTFGAGKEPTTIEEFNRLTMGFDFETYNTGTIESTDITKITTRKQYVSVDAGTLSWYLNSVGAFETSSLTKIVKAPSANSIKANIVCSKYETKTVDAIYPAGSTEIGIGLNRAGSLICRDPSYANAAAFKQGMNGVIIQYQPLNPTDAEILTEVNLTTGTLNGVGTAQDEKTETELKKVIGSYTFTGNEPIQLTDWQPREGTYAVGFANSLLPNIKLLSDGAVLGNIRMADLGTTTFNDTYNGIVGVSVYAGGGTNYSIFIRVPTSIATDNATLLQWLVGKTIYYETKTPITLTKDYTAKVDLGTLNYFISNTNTGIVGTESLKLLIKTPTTNDKIANVLCLNYTTTKATDLYSNATEIVAVENNGTVNFKSLAFIGKTVSEVKALLSGVMFTYETTDKVSTPLNEIGFGEVLFKVQRGGTIETDSNGDITALQVVYKPIE